MSIYVYKQKLRRHTCCMKVTIFLSQWNKRNFWSTNALRSHYPQVNPKSISCCSLVGLDLREQTLSNLYRRSWFSQFLGWRVSSLNYQFREPSYSRNEQNSSKKAKPNFKLATSATRNHLCKISLVKFTLAFGTFRKFEVWCHSQQRKFWEFVGFISNVEKWKVLTSFHRMTFFSKQKNKCKKELLSLQTILRVVTKKQL